MRRDHKIAQNYQIILSLLLLGLVTISFTSNFKEIYSTDSNQQVDSNLSTGSNFKTQELDNSPYLKERTGSKASDYQINRKLLELQSLPTHGPLIITDDLDFANHENITGTGNSNDPYVFANFRIIANGPSGINISNTNKPFRIENVFITGSTDISPQVGAIDLYNVDNGQIINNTVINSQFGISITGDCDNLLIENNNISLNLYHGIRMIDTSNGNTIRTNKIENNGLYGILLGTGTNNNLLQENEIHNNGIRGIYLVSSSYNVLRTNSISGNGENGIDFFAAVFNNLTGNTVTSNGLHGICIRTTSTFNNISFNILRSNTHYNVQDNSTGTNYWVSNYYWDYTGGGTYPISGTAGAIDTNPNSRVWVNGNSDFAFKAMERGWSGNGSKSNPYQIKNYFIIGHDLRGVWITETNVFYILENIWVDRTEAFYAAFGFFNSSNAVIRNNTASNGYDGFSFSYHSDSNLLIGNTAYNNSHYGFHVGTYCNDYNLTNNIAEKNSGFGFYVTHNVADVTCRNNLALENTDSGFNFYNTLLNVTVVNNSAINNTGNGFDIDSFDFSRNRFFTVINNSAVGNANGFWFEESKDSILANNSAINNIDSGFVLFNSDDNNLIQNKADNNGDYGIKLDSGIRNNITLNSAFRNGLSGYFISCHYSFLIANHASLNNDFGYEIVGGNENFFDSNLASNNTLDGFFSGGEANYFLKNTAIFHTETNESFGFNIGFAKNNVLIQNNISHNSNGIFIGVNSWGMHVLIGNFLSNHYENAVDNDVPATYELPNTWYGNIYSDYNGTGYYLISGTANAVDVFPVMLDSDFDGLPDWYELYYGFNHLLNDSFLDFDNDGFSNLEEFYLGMNPVVSDNLPLVTTTSAELTTTTETTTESSNASGFVVFIVLIGMVGVTVTLRRGRKET